MVQLLHYLFREVLLDLGGKFSEDFYAIGLLHSIFSKERYLNEYREAIEND